MQLLKKNLKKTTLQSEHFYLQLFFLSLSVKDNYPHFTNNNKKEMESQENALPKIIIVIFYHHHSHQLQQQQNNEHVLTPTLLYIHISFNPYRQTPCEVNAIISIL